MNYIYWTLLGIGTVTVAVGAWTIGAGIFRAWREVRAHQHVESLFLEQWDRSPDHRLLAWLQVQRKLINNQAPNAHIKAAKNQIALLKEQHRTHQRMKLNDGRTVIISTLN